MAQGGWRGKRTFDVGVSFLLLLLFVPAMFLVALSIRLSSAGPVIFRQRRVGRGGREFNILKFRTMQPDAEDRLRADPVLAQMYFESGHKIPLGADPRITRVGRFLRRFSLDEVPQLFNVLRGDMSLVGPRPIVATELHHYENDDAYLTVRPGLTGLWQVSGRDEIQFPHRAELDSTYVHTCSLGADIGILLRTPLVVISSRGTV